MRAGLLPVPGDVRTLVSAGILPSAVRLSPPAGRRIGPRTGPPHPGCVAPESCARARRTAIRRPGQDVRVRQPCRPLPGSRACTVTRKRGVGCGDSGRTEPARLLAGPSRPLPRTSTNAAWILPRRARQRSRVDAGAASRRRQRRRRPRSHAAAVESRRRRGLLPVPSRRHSPRRAAPSRALG